MEKIYTTAECLTQKFIKDDWSKNISFSELTLEEAKEKGYSFAITGINHGRKYFKMNDVGHIYDDNGILQMYNNIKVAL